MNREEDCKMGQQRLYLLGTILGEICCAHQGPQNCKKIQNMEIKGDTSTLAQCNLVRRNDRKIYDCHHGS